MDIVRLLKGIEGFNESIMRLIESGKFDDARKSVTGLKKILKEEEQGIKRYHSGNGFLIAVEILEESLSKKDDSIPSDVRQFKAYLNQFYIAVESNNKYDSNPSSKL